MKKQIGILLAVVLILLLGWNLLSAPAVRETDPPEEDIAGSDWRTWGIIDDQGTLVRGGETHRLLRLRPHGGHRPLL